MASIGNLTPAQKLSLHNSPRDWRHVITSKDDHGVMHAVVVDGNNASRRAQQALRDRFADADSWRPGFEPKLRTLQVIDGLREYIGLPG